MPRASASARAVITVASALACAVITGAFAFCVAILTVKERASEITDAPGGDLSDLVDTRYKRYIGDIHDPHSILGTGGSQLACTA